MVNLLALHVIERRAINMSTKKPSPRDWQAKQLTKYKSLGKSIWTTVAGTGTGKTISTGFIVEDFLTKNPNGLVVVIAPLTEVVEGWVTTMDCDEEDPCKLCFHIPSVSNVLDIDNEVKVFATTYASDLSTLLFTLQKLDRPVCLILDEFHRLEESVEEGKSSSTWTNNVINLVEGLGGLLKLHINLTATPWRESPNVKLPFIKYNEENLVEWDYKHSYGDELGYGKKAGVVSVGFRGFDANYKVIATKSKPVWLNNYREANKEVCKKDADGYYNIDTTLMLKFDPASEDPTIAKNSIRYRQPPMRNMVDVDTDKKLLEREYIREMIMRAANDLTDIRRTNENAKGLVIARNIDSAKVIAAYMRANGINVRVIHSKSKTKKDDLTAFRRNKEVAWAISVGMLSEGVDVPPAKILVDLSDRLTLRDIIQRWGRVLRRCKLTGHLAAKIYHVKHPMLNYLAEQILNEINCALKIAEKREGEGGREGGESNTNYKDHSGSANGAVGDNDHFKEDEAHLADWMFRTSYGAMTEYTLCLTHARLCLSSGLYPDGYDPSTNYSLEDEMPEQPHRVKIKEKKDRVTKWVTEIAKTGHYSDIRMTEGLGAACREVNRSVKISLVKAGYIPDTHDYKEARYTLIDQIRTRLGIDYDPTV